MRLNLNFYKERENEKDTVEDEKILEIIENNSNIEEILRTDNSISSYLHLSRIKENLLNWYEFKSNSSVLEVGAGFGELVELFSKKFEKVTLIEESKRKAEAIQKRFEHLGDNVSLIVRKPREYKFK